MGICWKNVDNQPPAEGFVEFAGDKTALSKRWPILWRYQQNWYSLKVEIPGSSQSGYCVFFQAGDRTMQYRRFVSTIYIMVRVGQGPVKFWVETWDGRFGKLSRTAGMKPGLLRPNSHLSGHAILAQQRLHGSHTYI